MPHLQLELSRDIAEGIDLDEVLAALADELASLETVDPKSVKAYARVADSWAMGKGAPVGFAHLTVCVLAGRTTSWEAQTSDRIYAQMRGLFGGLKETDRVSLTLELRRMDPETYRK